MKKRKAPYAQGSSIAPRRVAATNPIGVATLNKATPIGTPTPASVPSRIGVTSGLNIPLHQPSMKLKMSGHSGAHRVGKRK